MDSFIIVQLIKGFFLPSFSDSILFLLENRTPQTFQFCSFAGLQAKMFSKWIRFLLKFFDICGFYTEIHSLKGSKGNGTIFLLHIFWAFAATITVITFSMSTLALSGVLPYMVNNTLQNLSGAFIYWIIIFESFTQRKIQQKFWHIYQCIHTDQNHKLRHRNFQIYLIKLITYFSAILPINFYLMYYFLSFVENFFLFRFSYAFFVIMYQSRIFYYLFYLELIKHELMAIESALKDGASVGREEMKTVHKHYSQICELNDCINQIFGWSNFVAVLYCFELPLTDANWAYTSFAERPMEYIYGI